MEGIGVLVRACRELMGTLGLGAVACVSMILHIMSLQGPAWDPEGPGRPAVSRCLAEVYLYEPMP